jgi:hypothetical protein
MSSIYTYRPQGKDWMAKRNFSKLTIKDVMLLLHQQDFTRW